MHRINAIYNQEVRLSIVFDCPQKRDDDTRINNEIRVPRVRVISNEGEALGIMHVSRGAYPGRMAAGLDLVEISPNADPPVCRIMDYGKFKYEKSKKVKEAKKKQHVMHLKEIKLHPKTDEHDFDFQDGTCAEVSC